MARKKLCIIVGENKFEAGMQYQELGNPSVCNLGKLTKEEVF